jgi:hypothetical protein
MRFSKKKKREKAKRTLEFLYDKSPAFQQFVIIMQLSYPINVEFAPTPHILKIDPFHLRK